MKTLARITITVSGPPKCGKSNVVRAIYAALRLLGVADIEIRSADVKLPVNLPGAVPQTTRIVICEAVSNDKVADWEAKD